MVYLKCNALCVLILIALGSLRASQGTVDSLNQVVLGLSNGNEKAAIYVLMAKLSQPIDLQKTKEYAILARQMIDSDDRLMLDATDQLGRYFFFTSQLDSSLYYFQEVRTILEEKDPKRSAEVDISIGSVLLRQGKYEDAIGTFVTSLEYFESSDDFQNAAKCYSNLASAYGGLKDYSSAIEYSHRALEIFRSEGQVQFEMITLPNLAAQYMQAGDSINATQYFEEAERLATRFNNKRSLSLIHNNLSNLYLGRQEYMKAESSSLKSIQLKKELNLQKGIEESYYNLGQSYLKRGRYRDAIKAYEIALATATGEIRVGILSQLKNSTKAVGQTKRALDYAESAQRLSDSLRTLNDMEVIAEISEKYETAKRENEILQLQNDNQRLSFHQRRQRNLLFGSFGLLGILLLTGYLSLKSNRRKRIIREQNHELEKQRMLEKLKQQELNAIDYIIEGQEKERSRIAADLHDSLGSKLATLRLYLDNFGENLNVEGNDFKKVNELAEMSYKEVREISHNINSGVLVDKGLIPALRSMASFASNANNLDVQIIDVDLERRLENQVEIQLFRVIQELITNVIKHADATEVTVQVTDHDDHINIIVEDNGKGFVPSQIEFGLGMQNIAHRLAKIGASHDIDSSPNAGTTIIINLPV